MARQQPSRERQPRRGSYSGTLLEEPRHEESKRLPRRVDFVRNADDLDVVAFGLLGWTTDAICSYTGLSKGQVLYRLGRVHVKRSDYRRGTSPVAEFVLSQYRSASPFKKHVTTYAVDKVQSADLYHPALQYRGVLSPEVQTGQESVVPARG